MSMLAPMALMLADLAEMTDDQFRAFVDGLRHELAPANFLEKFLVERIALCVGRMRRSARVEAEGQPLDAKWQRYESAAERAFWKAYNELMKGRRPKARSAPEADVAETAPAPVAVAPAPAPVVATPRPAAAPAPAPKVAPPAASLPPAAEPRRRTDRSPLSEANRRRIQAECLALMAAQEPAGTSTFLPISVAPAAPAAPKAEPVAAGS